MVPALAAWAALLAQLLVLIVPADRQKVSEKEGELLPRYGGKGWRLGQQSPGHMFPRPGELSQCPGWENFWKEPGAAVTLLQEEGQQWHLQATLMNSARESARRPESKP